MPASPASNFGVEGELEYEVFLEGRPSEAKTFSFRVELLAGNYRIHTKLLTSTFPPIRDPIHPKAESIDEVICQNRSGDLFCYGLTKTMRSSYVEVGFPPDLSYPGEALLWLCFCSASHFQDVANRRRFPMFESVAFENASEFIFEELPGGSGLPAHISYQAPSASRGARETSTWLEPDDVPPLPDSVFAVEFIVSKTASFRDNSLPEAAQLTSRHRLLRESTLRTLFCRRIAVTRYFTPEPFPPLFSDTSQAVPVVDYRFKHQLGDPLQYRLTNDVMLDRADPKLQDLLEAAMRSSGL